MLSYSTEKLDTEQPQHEFESTCFVEGYLYSGRPGFLPVIAYYIVIRDNVRGLYNKHGDFLYDIHNMDPGQVAACLEERSFFNWRTHNSIRPMYQQKVPLKKKSWGRECIEDCAGSLMIWMRHKRPDVRYDEALSVIRNEGYLINETTGEVTINPLMRQL